MKENNELLNLYIDGELENEDLDIFMQKLATNAQLAEELKGMKMVHSNLKQMEHEIAPDSITQKIMQKIALQTKAKIKGKNFFIGMVSFLSLIILGILGFIISLLDFSSAKSEIQISSKIVNYFSDLFTSIKEFLSIDSLSLSNLSQNSVYSSNTTFILSCMALFIILSALYLYNSHKNFHQKIKGF